MLEGTDAVPQADILQRIDRLLTVLKMVSEDIRLLSKDLKSFADSHNTAAQVQIGSKIYPRLLFLRDNVEEAWLRKFEENEQSWKNIRCCRNPFFKHDKVRGEVFCMNCGMVIVQKTFGQPGRKGGMWLGKSVGWEPENSYDDADEL